MDSYEKNVDKAVNVVEKAAGVANRLYIGCITIVANLFFAAFCLWGVYAGVLSWQLQTNGKSTTGVVVKMEKQNNTDGGCCAYVPIVEYVVIDRTYSIKGDTASDPPQYVVGERVPILYDPSNPNKAQINKLLERWLFPAIIIPAMIFTALVMNFFMWRAFRRNDVILE